MFVFFTHFGLYAFFFAPATLAAIGKEVLDFDLHDEDEENKGQFFAIAPDPAVKAETEELIIDEDAMIKKSATTTRCVIMVEDVVILSSLLIGVYCESSRGEVYYQ